MSITTDKDHFFQTCSSLEASTRRALKSINTHGSPIQVGSKILAVLADPASPDHVFIAESAGLARRVQLSSNTKGTHTYRGHTAPVTSLALSSPTSTSASYTLYTSSWDKTILAFNVITRSLLRRFPVAHADFIKCLLYLPPLPHPPSTPNPSPSGLLLSGSSDSTINIYNPTTTEKLTTLASHMRGVLCLALDPTSHTDNPSPSYTVLSGSSDREIRSWIIPADGSSADEAYAPLTVHETSIYSLHLPASDPGHLYTASADRTALHLTLPPPPPPQKIDPIESLPHPDFVTDITLAGFSPDGGDPMYIVTACRDEHVRLWDRATADLICTFEGHFEKVTGLCVVGQRGWTVVSVSIDGTVRRWGVKREEVNTVLAEQKKRAEGGGEEEEGGQGKLSVLTEEEERELAELMEESE